MLSLASKDGVNLMRQPTQTMPFPITAADLDSTVALIVAESMPLTKQEGERDTEFVKRIVCGYMNALVIARTLES
jgi:hypothetical protein